MTMLIRDNDGKRTKMARGGESKEAICSFNKPIDMHMETMEI